MPSAVDTNVFVRFLVDDGSGHVAPARRVFASGHVFVPTSVILESEWVLRSAFGFRRTQICDAFERVLGVPSITVQDADAVENAIASSRRGLDFADALHLNASADCDVLYTFDGPFIRRAGRIDPVPPVRKPSTPAVK
ncbi:MAG: type II toxin-antitoxin system VapC family toxin [Rhizobiaceae bacterium]